MENFPSQIIATLDFLLKKGIFCGLNIDWLSGPVKELITQ